MESTTQDGYEAAETGGARPGRTREKLLFLTGFAVYFGALWYLWETPAIYPLKIFVVMAHEISHGIASIATGGTIEKIVLDPQQGGACYCPGGSAFITLSAGYLGSLLWGVALLAVAGSRRLSNWRWLMMLLLGAAVVTLSVLYVRGGFGFFFGLGFGAALIAVGWLLGPKVGWRLGPRVAQVVLTTLGLTSCLYAILDIKSDVLDRPHLQSDAAMLAELTPGISTTTWGIAWITVAIAVSVLTFRRAYRAA